ncbi:MAG: tyrosine-type recombinase/integrase [Actinomycetota bacterium]
MRERRPGVWEVRVVVGNEPATGVSRQRSFTVYGDEDVVADRRRELVAQFGVDRSALYCRAAGWTVAELLEAFLVAEQAWSPATRSSHTSMARWLAAEPVGSTGVAVLTPQLVDVRIAVWRRSGASVALVWARWAVLHSCLSWATRQRLLRSNPIATMKAPPRPAPRKHLRMDEIATLLRAANAEVDAARRRVSPDLDRRRGWQQLFVAEQNLLLIRLAADTGARRGELATLRLSDLAGRVLTIERNLSLEILGPTKSKRTRRMTIGATTAAMVRQHFDSWSERLGSEVVGDWIFAPDYRRAVNARASLLSHRFARFRDRAKVPDARLHRFRHSVATALVEDGKILKAQARLGHRDAATTLRHYAHATPLDDLDVADELDRRLNAAAAG